MCEQWGLNDVDLEYSDADYSNLTTYKLFQQTFRPRIQAENPKVISIIGDGDYNELDAGTDVQADDACGGEVARVHQPGSGR